MRKAFRETRMKLHATYLETLRLLEWMDTGRKGKVLDGRQRTPIYPQKDERGGFVIDLRDRCDA